MKLDTNKKIAIIIIAADVILTIISFIVLPEKVITQLSFNSKGVSTMPKLIAIFIPFGFSLMGAISILLVKDKDYRKGYIVGIVGLLLFIIMLVVNTVM